MASEKIIKQKEEEVNKLADKMKDASIVILTEYRGINVADDTELRKTVEKQMQNMQLSRTTLQKEH